ncbi:MAG: YfhO family protein [Reichenbachiella sp.]|uniref:YfhO family protein n=1 Tax=Reichenbachiella sp. TaxID=2184521 RepID=UPI003263515C
MLNLNFKKDLLPHLVAIAIFCFTTVLFFAPVFFEGKSLPQHDITQWEGGAHELIEYREKTGEEGLWTNSMFSGMPGYMINVKFSGDLLKHVHRAYGLFLTYPMMTIFIGCLSFYILLLSMSVRSWLAIAGGIAYGFTAFSIIGLMAGHNAKISAVSTMPLVLAGIHLVFKGNKIWGFVITAIGLAIHLRPNHLQITYYLVLIVAAYGIMQLIMAIKEKEMSGFSKNSAILILAALLAVGANFGGLITTLEYSKYSTRGKSELSQTGESKSGLDKDYAFQYSNGIFEPLFLFIPNFYGGTARENLGANSNLENALRKNGANRQQIKQQVESAPAYWGNQPLTAPYYAGAIVVMLFVLSLFLLENKYKIWLAGLVLFALILSWGSNFGFNYFIFDYLPGYNKFRSVTFAIIIVVFAMILVGFLGLEKLLASDFNKRIQRKFLMAIAVVGGFAFLCAVFAGLGGYKGAIDAQLASYPDWYLKALRADRASLLRMDALRSLIFVLLFAGIVWALIREKLSKTIAYTLLIILVFVDMFGVAKRFINSDTFVRKSRQSEFQMSAADQVILKDKDINYRVMNLLNPFNDAKTSYHHKSIGGYHGAKLGRYQELIERCIAPEQSRVISALQGGSFDFENIGVLNMLNTKYFLAGSAANAVLPNLTANGNAWFISEVVEVESADEEINEVSQIDTKTTVVIDQSKFDISDQVSSANGEIRLVEYKPNYLKYQSTNDGYGLAVFSEIYYPEGWVATIDGEEVPILRTNYVLRALEIPKGEHVVEFEFKPRSYTLGNLVTLISNIVLILLLLGSVVYSLKQKTVLAVK